ncbi:MAG: hypothetical protein IH865_01625 [Chloroflexi bacterium]|nr:hypothetical protein [Chloroflexota bacterium]
MATAKAVACAFFWPALRGGRMAMRPYIAAAVACAFFWLALRGGRTTNARGSSLESFDKLRMATAVGR